jgi:hypothetical protein
MGQNGLICVCLLAAFVMSTMAFPEDEVVPETTLTLSLLSTRHPELKHATPKDAAHAKVKMLQAQGFDNTQCNKMATDAIIGMTSTLKVEQDAVDALSTGADCLVTTPATRRLLSVATAQQHLDAAAAALVAAKTDLATKEATLQANRVAPITLPLSFFLLTDSAAIMAAAAADPGIVAAKQAVATAQTARDAVNLDVVAAQATYDATLVDAQDASQECLCNAKTAHDLAWPGAQKIVTDNTPAWKEAHHVKCAVDGTADDACSVPVFAATDKPLVTEASSADCAVLTSVPKAVTKKYVFFKGFTNWDATKEACTNQGMTLATIESAEENAAAFSVCKTGSKNSLKCAFGLRNSLRGSESGLRSWVWPDGSNPGSNGVYVNWNQGEGSAENDGMDRLGMFTNDGLWHVRTASGSQGSKPTSYLCQQSTGVAPSAPSQGVLKLAGWGRDECLKPDEQGKLRFGQGCDYEFVHLESGALASASDNSKCIIGSMVENRHDVKLGPCPGAMSFQFSTAASWNGDEVQCISVDKGNGGIGWLTDYNWRASTSVPVIVDQNRPGVLCDPQSFPVDNTNGAWPRSKNFYWVAW